MLATQPIAFKCAALTDAWLVALTAFLLQRCADEPHVRQELCSSPASGELVRPLFWTSLNRPDPSLGGGLLRQDPRCKAKLNSLRSLEFTQTCLEAWCSNNRSHTHCSVPHTLSRRLSACDRLARVWMDAIFAGVRGDQQRGSLPARQEPVSPLLGLVASSSVAARLLPHNGTRNQNRRSAKGRYGSHLSGICLKTRLMQRACIVF